MTQPGKSDCRFCASAVDNDAGWPVCRECYEGGRYEAWVRRRLAQDALTADDRAELDRALLVIRGPG